MTQSPQNQQSAPSDTSPENLRALPLVVDLDRTLIRTDSLTEQFLVGLCQRPWRTVRTLFELRKGKAAFKSAVFRLGNLHTDAMIYNQELLDYLKAEKRAGRRLHLVTAANQGVADAIGRELGIFDSHIGSSAEENLKGQQKLTYLERAFPEGFVYAADSHADLAIWQKARGAILVGVNERLRKAVEAAGVPVERSFDPGRPTLRDWLRLMRLHQWAKNLLIFVPLLLGHRYTDSVAISLSMLGFLSIGLAASGTYIINDISDLRADRAQPSKRRRPIASGLVDAGHAVLVALLLIITGLAIMFSLSYAAAGILVLYLAATLTYSFIGKRLPLVDIFILAGLYTLRIILGITLVGTEFSYWLLLFSFFFFFSLSSAKRHVEIVTTRQRDPTLQRIPGRGYLVSDEPLTLTYGVATTVAALLILTLYVANDLYPVDAYSQPAWLWGDIVVIMMWTSRIWLLSHRGELDDDPVAFALSDRISLGLGLLMLVFFGLSNL